MATEPPESRDELCRLAATQRRAGRVPEALETLKRLESLYPPFGGLFEELGFCLLTMKEPAKAIAPFERAVGLNMCLLGSWRALASLYGAGGQPAQAQNATIQVTQLEALPAEIQLACSKFYDGEARIAEGLVRQYMADHGEHVEALRLLAKIASDAGAEFDAEMLLQKAVALAPGDETARHELALLLFKRRKLEAARKEVAQLLTLSPGNRSWRSLYAAASAAVGDYTTALPLYGELLQETPQDADLLLAIGNALKTTGKTQEAIDSYRYAAAARPGAGQAFWGLATMEGYRFTETEMAVMQQHENAAAPPVERFFLCFALGKALEDRGRFAESFTYYERGNALKKATLRYRPEPFERTAHRQTSFCTAEFFESRRGFGCDSAAPIFIVGLPRSGSAVIRQILAAHSQVDPTLEFAEIPRLARELQTGEPTPRRGYPGVLGALSAAMCKEFGERYLSDTAPYRMGKAGAPPAHFIDRMPHNFQYLDLIQLILPNAKVIDVRSDPVAGGFGMYKQLFATGAPFAYSFEDIARYHRMYTELMAHWERVLPGKILRVQYEEVVASFAPGVRRILDFCGLEFEPACLEPYQPVLQERINQWRNYERWLAPLKRQLAS
jgi:tetratricopeptide (TPR) repeat protein